MKKILFLLGITLFFSLSCEAKKVHIGKKDLPQQAQRFLSTYFPAEKMSFVMKDEKAFTTEYKVRTQGGYEIEFDANGAWEDVEGYKLPLGFLPEKIRTYIKDKFPAMTVTRIEKKKRGYELELNDDLELYFDKEGDFVRMDD